MNGGIVLVLVLLGLALVLRAAGRRMTGPSTRPEQQPP
jgi:hypothetical protein